MKNLKNIFIATGATAVLIAGASSLASAQHMPKMSELTKNEKVVTDWIREVYQARNAAAIYKFYAPNIKQHNPYVPGGAKGFYEYFSKKWKNIGPRPVKDKLDPPPYLMMAQGDLVLVVDKESSPDPQNPGKKYTHFWFDLFRVQNGKIVEHWDPAVKPAVPSK